MAATSSGTGMGVSVGISQGIGDHQAFTSGLNTTANVQEMLLQRQHRRQGLIIRMIPAQQVQQSMAD